MRFSERIVSRRLAICCCVAVVLCGVDSLTALRADQQGSGKKLALSSSDEPVMELPKKPSLPEPALVPPVKADAAPSGPQPGGASSPQQEMLAFLQSAAAREKAGQFAEGEAMYEKALAIARKLRGADHLDCGLILARIGILNLTAKQYEKAAVRLAEALPIFRQHLAPENPQVTLVVHELAMSLAKSNRCAEAAKLDAENLHIRESSLGKTHFSTLLSLHNLGWDYAYQQRWPEAVAMLEEWMARDKKGRLAKSVNMSEEFEWLGLGHEGLRHYDRAEKCFSRALTLQESQPRPDYAVEARLLRRLVQLCGFEREKGRANAHKYGEQCLNLCKERFGPENKETISALTFVGLAYSSVGDNDAGAKLLRECLQLQKKTGDNDSDNYWCSLLGLAQTDFRLKRFDDGQALAWSALDAMAGRLGNHRQVQGWGSMGEILAEAARHLPNRDELEVRLRQFVANVESLAGADDPAVANALNQVLEVYNRLESWERGRQIALQALAIERKVTYTSPFTLSYTLHQLGVTLEKQDKYDEAETYLVESVQIRWKRIGREDLELASCLCDLGLVYANTGRYMEAEATLRKSLRIAERFGSPEEVTKETKTNLEMLHADPKAAGFSMPAAALAKAQSFLLKGELDQAIVFYDEAIRLAPKVASAYSLRGLAYERKGRGVDALADYNEAIRLDPKRASSYMGRSRIYTDRGDIAEAISNLDRAIQLDPNVSVNYWSRALLFMRKTDFPKALADVNKAILLDPKIKDLPVLRAAFTFRPATLTRLSPSTTDWSRWTLSITRPTWVATLHI